MSYVIYSITPSVSLGKINILNIVNTEIQAEYYLRETFKNLAKNQVLAMITNQDVQKIQKLGYANGYYYVKESNTKYSVYNKFSNPATLSVDIVLTYYFIAKFEQKIESSNNDIRLSDHFCHYSNAGNYCYNLSNEMNGLCDSHQDQISNEPGHYVHCLQIIRMLSEKCKNTTVKIVRLEICKCICDFMALNLWMIGLHDKFPTVLINNLKDSLVYLTPDEKNIFDVEKYLKFFENPIDKDFIKSIDVAKFKTKLDVFLS